MESKFTEAHQKLSEDGNESKCDKTALLLDLMIDGEASTEEQAYFNTHIEECVSCFENHHKQKLLKGLVSGHLKRLIVPESLALSIKARILETV